MPLSRTVPLTVRQTHRSFIGERKRSGHGPKSAQRVESSIHAQKDSLTRRILFAARWFRCCWPCAPLLIHVDQRQRKQLCWSGNVVNTAAQGQQRLPPMRCANCCFGELRIATCNEMRTDQILCKFVFMFLKIHLTYPAQCAGTQVRERLNL